MPWPIPTLPALPDPEPPKLRHWLFVFVVVVAIGVLLVLLLWPTSKSTRSVEFWLLLVGTPMVVFTGALGMRLAMFEHAVSRKATWEQCRVQLAHEWALWCGRSQRITKASVFLAAGAHADQWLEDRDGLPVNSDRAVPLDFSPANTVEQWVTCLLGLVAERFVDEINGATGPLTLQVLLDEQTAIALRSLKLDMAGIFGRLVDEPSIDRVRRVDVLPTAGFETLDRWMDRNLEAPLLLIAAQRAIEDASTSYSEGAVALFFGPQGKRNATAEFGVDVYRPMQSNASALADDLIQVRGTQCVPAAQVDFWHTGLDGNAQGTVLAAGRSFADGDAARTHEALVHKFDEVAGRPGPLSSWISLGLAVQASTRRNRPQIVISACGTDAIVIGVVSTPMAG